MDIRATDTRTAYDQAISAILRARKAELKMTRAQLAEASGISAETFRYYLDGTRPVPVGNFFSLVMALKLEPGYVVEEARARVASITGD